MKYHLMLLFLLAACSNQSPTAFRGHEKEFQESVLLERQTLPLKNNIFRIDWRMTVSQQTVVYILREDEVLTRITYPVPDDADFTDINLDGHADITFLYGKTDDKKGTWHLLYNDSTNDFVPAAKLGEIPNLTRLEGTRFYYSMRYKCGGKSVNSILYYFGKDKIHRAGRIHVDQCQGAAKKGVRIWKYEFGKEKELYSRRKVVSTPSSYIQDYWKNKHSLF